MKDRLKIIVKKFPALEFFLRNIVQEYRFYKTKLIGFEAPAMLGSELDFFKTIYKDCEVIVDVGTRFDIDYVEISQGQGIKYFLFEANPIFYKKLKKNLKNIMDNEYIITENLAVGNSNSYMDYFEDSQSFVKNDKNIIKLNRVKKIQMIRLDEYFNKLKIKNIDFLKTDIEEYDYFALQGMGELLKNCKYIQFELGISTPCNNIDVTFKDYSLLLEEYFNLYILQDINNPYLQNNGINIEMFYFDDASKSMINNAVMDGIGFNIVAINKNITLKDIKTGKIVKENYFTNRLDSA